MGKASGVPRHEIFIANKISQTQDYGAEETPRLVNQQLARLIVDYFDVYMFHGDHNKFAKEVQAWRALEKLHDEGKVKALGLSNYDVEGIQRIMSFAKVKPVYLQIKYDVYHPGYQKADASQLELVSWAQRQGLTVVGYSSFSGWPFALRTLEDPHVKALAKAYGKSPGQLILRHSLQRGVAVIPSSTNKQRLRENTEIFDFQISREDMLRLDALAHLVSTANDDSPKWIPDIYGARRPTANRDVKTP